MNALTDKTACCGCSACAQVCPVRCITMEADEEGFLYPHVNRESCVGCGACERVCPILNALSAIDQQPAYAEPHAYGGWHRDKAVRNDSSSGGAFTLFANYVLEHGGIVFGASLDEDLVVRHLAVERLDDLAQLRGSKYVQSVIGAAYAQVKESLEQGRTVLFIGTPCQAAGLSCYLGGKHYDHLYIIDFICHGVPSPGVFCDYMKHLEERHEERIVSFQFRMRDGAWNPTDLQLGQGTCAVTESGKEIRHSPGFMDSYMTGFSDDLFLRPSCHECAFKTLPKAYSDLTIGDYWGVQKLDRELYDGRGTSLILTNSPKGESLFETVKKDFLYKSVDFRSAIQRNPSLLKSSVRTDRRDAFFGTYRKDGFAVAKRRYMNPCSWFVHKGASLAWNLIERTVKAITNPVIRHLSIPWSEERWEDLFQFIRFSMVGITNVLVSYSVNVCTLLLLRLLVPGIWFDYIIANTTAFLLSVLWSWHWNSKVVFRTQHSALNVFKSLLRCYASYALTGIFLNNLLGTFWIWVMGVSKFIAPLLNLSITVPINFLVLKKWAFRK